MNDENKHISFESESKTKLGAVTNTVAAHFDCSETTGYAGGAKKLLALRCKRKTPFDII